MTAPTTNRALPNRRARCLLLAFQEVMGRNGLNATLKMAGLQRYVGELPPADSGLELRASEYAALLRAVESQLGSGARGQLNRIGHAAFRQSLAADVWAWRQTAAVNALLPTRQRIRRALTRLAHTLAASGGRVEVRSEAGQLRLIDYASWPDRKGIEVLRVSIYNEADGTAGNFEGRLRRFAERLDGSGFGGEAELGAREVWFAGEVQGESGHRAYRYADYAGEFERRFPDAADGIRRQLTATPYDGNKLNTKALGLPDRYQDGDLEQADLAFARKGSVSFDAEGRALIRALDGTHGRERPGEICWLTLGEIQECLHWVTGRAYEVTETACKARGDEACIFVIGQRIG